MANTPKGEGLITAFVATTALLWWARRIKRGDAERFDRRAIEVVGARECDAEGVSRFAKPRSIGLEALVIAALPMLGRRERVTILAAPLAVCVGGTLLKKWIPRERPAKHRFEPTGGESFPSTHTAHAMALSLAISYVAEAHGARGGSILAALLTALVGVERVRGASHWPSDVMAGALLGLASANVARVSAQMST